MSADGSILLSWAGEERKFRLGLGQLRELQENVNRWRAEIGAPLIGPSSLARSFQQMDAWPGDVREVIRLGLIGGGVAIGQVPALIKRYVDDRPLAESTVVAHSVLIAAIVGVPDDPVGKKPQRTARAKRGRSSSPPSTASGAR